MIPDPVDPATALAWSEDCLDAVTSPALALWRPEGMTVALGLAQQPEIETRADALGRDGVGLVRRQSGGGAVLLMPGVLCWEARAREEDIAASLGDGGIRPGYRFLTGPVRDGLATLGVTAVQAGVSDVSVWHRGSLRKIAGTAQLRRRGAVLVHGSLLVCPDLALLDRYLRFPSSQPDYRADRAHGDFCVSLAALLPGIPPQDLLSRTAAAIADAAARAGWETETVPAALPSGADRLLDRKYRSADWNWRKIRPAD